MYTHSYVRSIVSYRIDARPTLRTCDGICRTGQDGDIQPDPCLAERVGAALRITRGATEGSGGGFHPVVDSVRVASGVPCGRIDMNQDILRKRMV